MQAPRIGPLGVRAAGGSDRKGGGDGPAIVLCHGYGAPGDDLVALARVADVGREVRWFFPEAPIELDLGWGSTGRAWWPIDVERIQRIAAGGDVGALMAETPPGLASARAKLEETLAALEGEHGVRRDRTILGGFSQGAMLATEIALHAEAPFAGLAILSGALVSADRWSAAAAARGASIHALMTHGRNDPILPFASAEALRALLVEGGASVDWVPHNGQHEIPEVALARLGTFARRRFGER